MLDVAAVARTFLESGYTLIIGAGVLQPLDDILAKDSIDRGLMPGPRIVPSGPMVTEAGGLGADGGLMEVAADARELREIVARQCDGGRPGAQAVHLRRRRSCPSSRPRTSYMNDEMLSAAVDEAARHGAFITVHARGSASVAMAARTGVRHHPPRLLPRRRGARARWRPAATTSGSAPGCTTCTPWSTATPSRGASPPEQIEPSGYRDELESPGRRAAAAAGSRHPDPGRRRLRPPVDPPRHLRGRARSATSSWSA